MTSIPAPARLSLGENLDKARASGLFRERRTLDSAQGAVVHAGGRRLINFCSNDYLGLAGDARLVAALQSAAAREGVGGGASQLVCGRGRAHERLEEAVAAHVGRSRALIFSSGYLANLAAITTFAPGRHDLVALDRDSHASLVDGALLSRARLRRYRRNDAARLETLLAGGRRALVATDSVFSMDGAVAPLPALAALCEKHGALLVVDDAHGFGVLGERGAGAAEHFSLDENRLPVLMATFGKACGAMGAFVAGPDEVIESIIQGGRSYIYTTAMAPAVAAAATRALAIVARESWRRERLRFLVERFVQGAEQLGLPMLPSDMPIQGFLAGSARAAMRCSEYAWEQGFWINAMRAPTVPKNAERLRITLTAGHDEEQVDRLLELLEQLARRL